MPRIIPFLIAAWLEAAPVAAEPALVLRPCKAPGVAEALRCGELLVPENPSERDGRHIKLHFVVVPALAAERGRAPLFDLAGGPGLAVTGMASFYATDGKAHRQARDVVLVDQRGTGESSPLRCPELELAGSLQPMYPKEAVARCRKTLERHADLSQYTTANTVADLEAVRSALGYDRVDLFGLSYGTRLALAYADLHPDRVRAAFLMGVVPADAKAPLGHARNAQATLEQVFDDCVADRACRTAYPGLRDEWRGVLANPAFDGPSREAFRTLLGSAAGQRTLPKLVHAMAGGDLRPFRTRFAGQDSAQFAEGLYLSIACAEDGHAIEPAQRLEAAQDTFLGSYRVDEQAAACSVWNVPPAPLTYGTRKRDVPVLAVAGGRDYVTPLEWTHRTVHAFPRSRVVVVPSLGHNPEGVENIGCLEAMVAAFFARGNVGDVDDSCLATMKAAPFAVDAVEPP